jgi:hypothetical protein
MCGKLVCIAAAGCTLFAFADEKAESDGEVWNAGVSAYRKGDVTNALSVLRPLMLSRTHGARAAEVVAKLEYDRGNREEAAVAAQIALRAAPGDARLNRNFTRAADGLAEARKTKRINEVLKRYQGQDPGALMLSSTKDLRKLTEEAGVYRTNAAPRAVALSDALSARAGKLSECWIPLREAVVQSVTNREDAAAMVMQVEAAQAKTDKAAEELSDMDASAYSTLADVEHDYTRMLKLVIAPPAALDEDLLCQSNAWKDVEEFNSRPWQREALDYTRAFRAKFPQWARAYEQKAQSDTNLPPFTAEDQAKVSALATELEKLQLECVEKNLPPVQEKAIARILEIRELLPKDGGGQGGGQGGSGDDSRNGQNDNDGRQENDKKPENGNDDGQLPENEGQDENKDGSGEEERKDDSGESGDEDENREVEAVLKKAQERNDEHEAEKKARIRKAPMPPNERDW